jgi:hypothetical protein
MLNIVEKYSAETVVESEEGVVAIEYVITAAALVVALGVACRTAFGDLTLSEAHRHGSSAEPDPTSSGGGRPPPGPGPLLMKRSPQLPRDDRGVVALEFVLACRSCSC